MSNKAQKSKPMYGFLVLSILAMVFGSLLMVSSVMVFAKEQQQLKDMLKSTVCECKLDGECCKECNKKTDPDCFLDFFYGIPDDPMSYFCDTTFCSMDWQGWLLIDWEAPGKAPEVYTYRLVDEHRYVKSRTQSAACASYKGYWTYEFTLPPDANYGGYKTVLLIPAEKKVMGVTGYIEVTSPNQPENCFLLLMVIDRAGHRPKWRKFYTRGRRDQGLAPHHPGQ